MQCFPIFFEETNGCFSIDDAPLTPKTRDVILSCIVGIFFVLLHSESFPVLTNQSFAFGLFRPNHIPDKHLWNKFASPIDNAEEIGAFFTDCFMVDNIDLSWTLDPSAPNISILDYCMCDNV